MEKLMDLIKANDTCTLATCSNNKPRASIMAYMVVEDQIIFATGADSIKGKNLLANPQVSLSISALPLYTTIDGTVVEPSEPEKQAYNEQLFIKYPEFKELMTNGQFPCFTYFKVIPQKAYFNDAAKGMVPPEIISF